VTRARADGGIAGWIKSVTRAYVTKEDGKWLGVRACRASGRLCDTWAEALAYALGEDET
jgi:hypothetical protein